MTVQKATLVLSSLLILTTVAGAQSPERGRRRTPVVEVFESCRDAVVNVSTTRVQRIRMLTPGSLWDDIFDFNRPLVREREVQSIGSGVVIHQNGYVVTNAHVVAQATDVKVIFADRRAVEAAIVATDAKHDLAVLKISSPAPLPYVRLGNSDEIMIGETVVAIGNPLGLQHTVTSGIVSALDRELRFRENVSYSGLIQTDAAINAGNSGGPLLNVDAELIGINTAILGDAQNVGFAIPVNRLWELLPDMLDIERRQRVRFGLAVAGPHAEIRAVRPNSPAANAGLLPGDRIVRFQKDRIRDAIDYYVHLLEQQPGQTIRLAYIRDDDEREVGVPLEAAPAPDGRGLAQRLLGISLEEFDPAARRKYQLPPGVGVYVDDVESGSPADAARMLPGDIIRGLNRMSVTSIEEVGLALEGVQPGQRIDIHGWRIRTQTPFAWNIEIPTRR